MGKHKKILRNSLITVVAMVGFSFALVPLYDVFCEITGLNGKTGVIDVQQAQLSDVANHSLTMQFDGTVNSNLPWEFKPVAFSMDIVPGKMYTAEFYAKNLSDVDIVGQAVPSVAPNIMGKYLNKTECFCFTQQLLKPGEEVLMPVTFIVSSDIPEHVDVLTLSYTFFNLDGVALETKNQNAAINKKKI